MLWHLRHGGTSAVGAWHRRQRASQGIFSVDNAEGAEGAWTRRGKSRHLVFAPAQSTANTGPRRNVRAAIILDEFSALAFSYEWETFPLTPLNWRRVILEEHVDLLFVESAWHGSSDAWKYQLSGPTGPSESFKEMVEGFRNHGTPTVFWNKEDPPHYQDFLPTAKLFDHVFTSDSDKVASYTEDLGHNRVFTLTFAAQPALHNPVRPRKGWHTRDLAFAGMYFTDKFPERRSQMDLLLGAATDVSESMDTGLEIFSRQLGGAAQYQFPEHLRRRVVGSLPYSQMLTAYKAYKVFLNVNSVIGSPSMCARRVFEIAASGTPVVSTRSAAIEALFPDEEIPIVDTVDQARNVLSALVRQRSLGDRQVHRAQRRIWNAHTYAHRAEQILAVAAPEKTQPVTLPSLSVIVSTIRPHQLDHVFRTVSCQLGVSLELVLLTHGFIVPTSELDDLRRRYHLEALTVLTAPASQSLGECLNDCVAAATGEILTKMDDDDFYGPHYLLDQLHALDYSGAEVVGKQAHYMYVQRYNATVLRFAHKEHRFTNMVMGPTLMAAGDVFRRFRFEQRTRGEDTAFLEAVIAASGSVYSADKFNYYQQRSGSGHTWQVSDQEILTNADITFFGRPDCHVSI
ncbi:glycosyltransferase [Arthrobacter sp. H20]|uniref:glycosyltransferase n=1 Tax=Arthrobacter sp. H20 TaxID=1267981 RepID=UPI0004AD2C13|nr:glycosyltransferase [Arthrobacter sp. H20]